MSGCLSSVVGLYDTSPVHSFLHGFLYNVVPPLFSFLSHTFSFQFWTSVSYLFCFFSFSVASSLCNRHLAKAPTPPLPVDSRALEEPAATGTLTRRRAISFLHHVCPSLLPFLFHPCVWGYAVLCVSVRDLSAPGASPTEWRLPKVTEVMAGGESLALMWDTALG